MSRDAVFFENLFENNVNFRLRVIYLSGDIEESSLVLFQKAMDEFEKTPDRPIRIEISSEGGDVYDMLGIVDRMLASPCHIVTRGFGKIMSAATFILAAGNERIMGANSCMMIHETSDWIKGTLTDMKIEFDQLEKLEKHCNKLLEQLTKAKTKAKTFERLNRKNCYLTAEEALKLGLIDKVL